jgi:hypothetical protein
MSMQRLLSCALLASIAAAGPVWAQGAALEVPVKKVHLFGASHGALVVSEQGVEYRTSDKKDARRWSFEQIKQIQVLSPTRIAVRTYTDRSWVQFWTDRNVEFQLEKGSVSPELVSFLVAKVPRPVMTSVLPVATHPPLFRVPVKHLRTRSGTHGDLVLYDDALVYESATAGASRYWRFGDIASAFALDRFRLDVLTYEGGGGDTRPFTFQLKADLPPGFYDTLWGFLNPPAPLRQTTGR